MCLNDRQLLVKLGRLCFMVMMLFLWSVSVMDIPVAMTIMLRDHHGAALWLYD